MIRHENALGVFEFHPRYVIGEYREGVEIGAGEIAQLQVLFDRHFEDGFGFIDNRIHSCSFAYSGLEAIRNVFGLRAISVVAYERITVQVVEMARMFVDVIPIELHRDLEQAKQWIADTVAGGRTDG